MNNGFFPGKILAGLALAVAAAVAAGFLSDQLVVSEPPKVKGYDIAATETAPPADAPVATATVPGRAAPETAEAPAAPSGPDPAAGKKAARACIACHTFNKGGPNRAGPNLWGVVGRAAGGSAGFAYSPAFRKLTGRIWTEAALDAYLKNPRADVPGTRMLFAGLPREADRADLIAYLKTLK